MSQHSKEVHVPEIGVISRLSRLTGFPALSPKLFSPPYLTLLSHQHPLSTYQYRLSTPILPLRTVQMRI